MSTICVFVYLLLGLFASATAGTVVPGVPAGYILQVTPTCGPDGVSDASIDIITDLNADAKAYCANDVEVDFTNIDGVNFNLSVTYPPYTNVPCQFWQRNNSLVYAIKVIVSYGETGSFVHGYELEYTVTCTFDPQATDSSESQNIIEGLIAPTELQTNVGPDSVYGFTLQLVDVLGYTLVGQNVPLGKTVLLSANIGGVGLRPVSCNASDGTNTYAILRAGCGDGIVFRQEDGFTTTGSVTTSPYFQAFSINTAVVVNFHCNFIECLSPCDGSSCANEA